MKEGSHKKNSKSKTYSEWFPQLVLKKIHVASERKNME